MSDNSSSVLTCFGEIQFRDHHALALHWPFFFKQIARANASKVPGTAAAGGVFLTCAVWIVNCRAETPQLERVGLIPIAIAGLQATHRYDKDADSSGATLGVCKSSFLEEGA